jgi:hypothetical protein
LVVAAVTVNVDVVFEATAEAVPENAAVDEEKESPAGNEPDVIEYVIVSLSLSVAAAEERVYDDLAASPIVPNDPEAVLKNGLVSTDIQESNTLLKPEALVTLTLYGSFAFTKELYGTVIVRDDALLNVVVEGDILLPEVANNKTTDEDVNKVPVITIEAFPDKELSINAEVKGPAPFILTVRTEGGLSIGFQAVPV